MPPQTRAVSVTRTLVDRVPAVCPAPAKGYPQPINPDGIYNILD